MPNVLEPDSNESNKPKIDQAVTSLSELPIEKQFTHRMFLTQIQTIDLEAARELLGELHLLYLGQQTIFVKMTKQEFLGGM